MWKLIFFLFILGTTNSFADTVRASSVRPIVTNTEVLTAIWGTGEVVDDVTRQLRLRNNYNDPIELPNPDEYISLNKADCLKDIREIAFYLLRAQSWLDNHIFGADTGEIQRDLRAGGKDELISSAQAACLIPGTAANSVMQSRFDSINTQAKGIANDIQWALWVQNDLQRLKPRVDAIVGLIFQNFRDVSQFQVADERRAPVAPSPPPPRRELHGYCITVDNYDGYYVDGEYSECVYDGQYCERPHCDSYNEYCEGAYRRGVCRGN